MSAHTELFNNYKVFNFEKALLISSSPQQPQLRCQNLTWICFYFQTFCIGLISDLVLYISILDLVFISSLVVFQWMLWSFMLLFKTWYVSNLVASFMNALVIYKYYFGLALFGMFSTWLIPLWMIVSILAFLSFWCCQRWRESCKVSGIYFFCKPFWKYFLLSNDCKIKGEWLSRKRNIFQ